MFLIIIRQNVSSQNENQKHIKVSAKEKILKKLGLSGGSAIMTVLLLLQFLSICNYMYKCYKIIFKWRDNFLISLGGFVGSVISAEGKTFAHLVNK
jgi:hypothetical protein